MPYKELTPDYILGRVLVAERLHWRVLAVDIERDTVRCCLELSEDVRTVLQWSAVRRLIQDGLLTVD